MNHLTRLLPLLLLTACKPPAPPTIKAAPPPVVQIIHAEKGGIARSITLPARVRAWQEATLLARASGYVKSITVDRGTVVKMGDTLVELDVPELLADMAKARAELAAAELEASRLSEAVKKSPDLVAPQDADAAQAKAAIARAMLQRCEALAGFARIIAPFEGIITRRSVDPGTFVEADKTIIAHLADFQKVRVELDVPQTDAVFLKSGIKAAIHLDELPDRSFPGTLSRMADTFDTMTKTMPVEVDVDNADRALRPGMFASVKLALETRADVLLLPAEALIMEKKKAFVFVHREGKAMRTAVKTGYDDGLNIEILEGITAVDEIISGGKQTLSDGQTITISKP